MGVGLGRLLAASEPRGCTGRHRTADDAACGERPGGTARGPPSKEGGEPGLVGSRDCRRSPRASSCASLPSTALTPRTRGPVPCSHVCWRGALWDCAFLVSHLVSPTTATYTFFRKPGPLLCGLPSAAAAAVRRPACRRRRPAAQPPCPPLPPLPSPPPPCPGHSGPARQAGHSARLPASLAGGGGGRGWCRGSHHHG